MDRRWLQEVYDDYRRGDPETVRGVRTLQRKVAIGCACDRDVAVLKGLDAVHIGQEARVQTDVEAFVFVSDALLRSFLDLIAQARRPASVNLLTAGTSPMRQHGGTARTSVSGYYDYGPFFGKAAGGHAAPSGVHHAAPSGRHHAMPSGGHAHHHGVRHRPGSGFASWIGPWGIWPDDCYLDVYGRIWCWGPYGWQVVG